MQIRSNEELIAALDKEGFTGGRALDVVADPPRCDLIVQPADFYKREPIMDAKTKKPSTDGEGNVRTRMVPAGPKNRLEKKDAPKLKTLLGSMNVSFREIQYRSPRLLVVDIKLKDAPKAKVAAEEKAVGASA